MKKRLITGIFLVCIFGPFFLIKPLLPGLEIIFAILCGFASYELAKLYDENHKVNKAVQWISILFSIGLFYLLVVYGGKKDSDFVVLKCYFTPNIQILFGSIFLMLGILLGWMIFDPNYDGKKITHSLIQIGYSAFGFASIVILRSYSYELFIYLFAITILTDVFAYVTGMLFGKHKLCPSISPKKTIEGSIGGTCIATIFGSLFAILAVKGTIFSEICPIDTWKTVFQVILVVVLSICFSIISQIGDLVASRLKRTYDVKDYSNLFPGHGGVMDRFDSSVYLAIFMVSILWIIGVIL